MKIFTYCFSFLTLTSLFLFESCNFKEVPMLETIAVSNVSANGASSGGTITDDGGADILERGISWSTLPEPNISNFSTSDGADFGSFVSQMTGLERNTKYYVRAYATNSKGTGYGNQLEFTTNLFSEVVVNGTTYSFHPDASFISIWGDDMPDTDAKSASNGQENTTKLSKLSGYFAAKQCAELNVLGFDDWFLPASQELLTIYSKDAGIFNPTNKAFWTSTDAGEGVSGAANFLKINSNYVEITLSGKDAALPCLCTRIKK